MVRVEAVDDEGVQSDDEGGREDSDDVEGGEGDALVGGVGVLQGDVCEGEGLVEGLDGVEGEEEDGEEDDEEVVDDVARFVGGQLAMCGIGVRRKGEGETHETRTRQRRGSLGAAEYVRSIVLRVPGSCCVFVVAALAEEDRQNLPKKSRTFFSPKQKKDFMLQSRGGRFIPL